MSIYVEHYKTLPNDEPQHLVLWTPKQCLKIKKTTASSKNFAIGYYFLKQLVLFLIIWNHIHKDINLRVNKE